MNEQMQDLNCIIDLCDKMIEFIKAKGLIHTGNELYEAYKIRIDLFFANTI